MVANRKAVVAVILLARTPLCCLCFGIVEQAPLFRFGVVADVQFADIGDGPNYARTRTRRYRQSLEILREASGVWNEGGVDFCVELGDLLDRKAVSKRWLALASVKRAMMEHAWHVPVGNHDLSVFSREELHGALLHRAPSPDVLYYEWRPALGFRCCVLDAYRVSVVEDNGNQAGKAARLLAANNPNIDPKNPAKPSSATKGGGGWLSGLDNPDDHRWVPYNGAYGRAQLDWFKRLLEDVDEKDETLFVFSHPPVYRPASKPNNLAWDYPDLLAALDGHRERVLFFAGHDHDGGYATRNNNEHHLTLAAPIECDPGQVAYATANVYPDRVRFDWVGKVPEDTAQPWPHQISLVKSDLFELNADKSSSSSSSTNVAQS